MKLITAIALFEAGYIFKERNDKFTSGYRPYKPDYSKSVVTRYVDSFIDSFKKKHEQHKLYEAIKNVEFNTKDDAWEVLDQMNREIGRYAYCSVIDFYDFSGISHTFDRKLFKIGWTDLSKTHPIMKINRKWIIDFPEPVELER